MAKFQNPDNLSGDLEDLEPQYSELMRAGRVLQAGRILDALIRDGRKQEARYLEKKYRDRWTIMGNIIGYLFSFAVTLALLILIFKLLS